MLEIDMIKDSLVYLSNTNEYTVLKQEVPFLSRCIDLVMIDVHGEVISIEFKVKNWRHAIEQAVNHKLGSDKAYICIPKRSLTETLTNAISKAGIGLLFYDGESNESVYEVIPPPKEHTNIPAFKHMLLSNVSRV